MANAERQQRAPRKPHFIRGQQMVAVKRIRLSSKNWIEPGQKLPKTLRRFVVLTWWRRGLIGPKGDPWTKWQLAKYDARLAREEERREAAATEAEPTTEDVVDEPTEPAVEEAETVVQEAEPTTEDVPVEEDEEPQG